MKRTENLMRQPPNTQSNYESTPNRFVFFLLLKCKNSTFNDFPNNVLIKVQEARSQHDDEAVKRAINEYEDALGRYIPVLMAQAKIYWDLEMYQQVLLD